MRFSSNMNDDSPRRSLSVFLVENHPDTLRYLKLYLEQSGHQVQTACSVTQALRLIPEAEFDVLISDIGLPDGDGWELMSQIYPTKPVFGIAMSGFGGNANLEKSRSVGFKHHLIKPFVPDELDALLDEALHSLAA
jgi:two-component system CheB/CheR fusion protein